MQTHVFSSMDTCITIMGQRLVGFLTRMYANNAFQRYVRV